VVSWLVRHRWSRWQGVTAVVAGTGPTRTTKPSTLIGGLNARFGLQQYLSSGQLLTAGRAAFGALGSGVVVVVLAVYLLADMRRIRRTAYRFVPASRRPRAVLLGDAISQRIGGYVLGNVLVSLIAGLSSLVVLLVLGVPYPFLLATVVAVLDLIPVAGSVTAGISATPTVVCAPDVMPCAPSGRATRAWRRRWRSGSPPAATASTTAAGGPGPASSRWDGARPACR